MLGCWGVGRAQDPLRLAGAVNKIRWLPLRGTLQPRNLLHPRASSRGSGKGDGPCQLNHLVRQKQTCLAARLASPMVDRLPQIAVWSVLCVVTSGRKGIGRTSLTTPAFGWPATIVQISRRWRLTLHRKATANWRRTIRNWLPEAERGDRALLPARYPARSRGRHGTGPVHAAP